MLIFSIWACLFLIYCTFIFNLFKLYLNLFLRTFLGEQRFQYKAHLFHIKNPAFEGTWLVQLGEYVTLDLGVVSSSPMLGVEMI